MSLVHASELSQGALAFNRLMHAIEGGVYRPGDRLREAEVAERLALSRTPVREALRRLEAENIVEHRPRIGAIIRKLKQSEIVELYEMRFVLERTAAEMAAKHAADAEIDEMEALNALVRAALNSPAQAAAVNQKFHKALYRAARNPFLLEAARAMNNALLLLGPTTLADPNRIKVVTQQHVDIIAGLRARDGAAAGAAAETHLQTSLRHRLQVMRG